METRVAVMSIIVEDPDAVESLNALLHSYGQYIIGRMGIPYHKRNISIISIALVSPVLAYLLGIAPQILTVPAIMVGNCVYVILLYFITGKDSKKIIRPIIAWVVAAAAKFATLYAIVVWLICGVFSKGLLKSGAMKPLCRKNMKTNNKAFGSCPCDGCLKLSKMEESL